MASVEPERQPLTEEHRRLRDVLLDATPLSSADLREEIDS